MKPYRSSLDPAYLRWRTEFATFEARCFEGLCEFVRAQFEELLDRYYSEGNQSLNGFPSWAFELYLRDIESSAASENLR
jgi:hypothetical protein